MAHYALIFRATRTLTPEDQKQRAADIAAWVNHVTQIGITLDPRNLGDTVANLSSNGTEIVSREGPGDPALITIVFFDAEGRDQAENIARIHPGLKYGVTVELREWSSPREAAARR
jgi:hypothetical protein